MRTSLFSILCIGIRLAAVLLAVNTALAIPGTYQLLRQGDAPVDGFAYVGLQIAILLLAFLLWVYPGVLARIAAGNAGHQIFESPIDAGELQTIAFSVVGLWILFGGVFGLAYDLTYELILRHAAHGAELGASELNAKLFGWIAGNVLRLIAGVALIVGSRGLVNWLARLRTVGLPPAEPVATDTEP